MSTSRYRREIGRPQAWAGRQERTALSSACERVAGLLMHRARRQIAAQLARIRDRYVIINIF
jgi:hypothetical protein